MNSHRKSVGQIRKSRKKSTPQWTREWPAEYPVLANLPESFKPSPEEIERFTGRYWGRKLSLVFMYASGRVVAHNTPTVNQRRTIAALSRGLDPEGYKKFSKEAILAFNKGASNERNPNRIKLPKELVLMVLDYIKPSFGVPTLRNLRAAGFDFVKNPPPLPGPTKRNKDDDTASGSSNF